MTIIFLNGAPVNMVLQEHMTRVQCDTALSLGVSAVVIDDEVIDASQFKFVCALEA